MIFGGLCPTIGYFNSLRMVAAVLKSMLETGQVQGRSPPGSKGGLCPLKQGDVAGAGREALCRGGEGGAQRGRTTATTLRRQSSRRSTGAARISCRSKMGLRPSPSLRTMRIRLGSRMRRSMSRSSGTSRYCTCGTGNLSLSG